MFVHFKNDMKIMCNLIDGNWSLSMSRKLLSLCSIIFFAALTLGCEAELPAPTSEIPDEVGATIIVSSSQTEIPDALSSTNIRQAILPPECTSPCWRGIEPGTTSYDDALTILENHYHPDNVEIDESFINWVSGTSDQSDNGSLKFYEGIVDDISVRFALESLTVEDFTKVIGEPEFVRIAKAFSSESDCAGASLVYSDLGLDVFLYPDKELTGVEKSQSVNLVIFLSPRLLENRNVTDSVMLEWDGYRDYCRNAFAKE